MAGAYAASRNPAILQWALAPTEGSLSAEATNLLHGVLRTAIENPIGWPSESKIGSVGEKATVQQLESNIAVLKKATGEIITDSAIETVPIGTTPATFGLQVDLRVHNLSELAPHIGDVFLGLATGLVGTPQATVEGLTINVVDDSGARASVWMNGRTGDGSALEPTKHSTQPMPTRPMRSSPSSMADRTAKNPRMGMGQKPVQAAARCRTRPDRRYRKAMANLMRAVLAACVSICTALSGAATQGARAPVSGRGRDRCTRRATSSGRTSLRSVAPRRLSRELHAKADAARRVCRRSNLADATGG